MRVVDYATLKGDGKTNQDRYLIGDYYAAVLDGASAYPPQPEGRDGGWYAEQLAASDRTAHDASDAPPERAGAGDRGGRLRSRPGPG